MSIVPTQVPATALSSLRQSSRKPCLLTSHYHLAESGESVLLDLLPCWSWLLLMVFLILVVNLRRVPGRSPLLAPAASISSAGAVFCWSSGMVSSIGFPFSSFGVATSEVSCTKQVGMLALPNSQFVVLDRRAPWQNIPLPGFFVSLFPLSPFIDSALSYELSYPPFSHNGKLSDESWICA